MNNEEAPKRVEEDEDGVKSCEQNLNPGGGDAGGSVLWCGRVEGPGNPSWTLRRSARSRALLLRTSLLLKKPHGRPRERPTMSSMATDRLKVSNRRQLMESIRGRSSLLTYKADLKDFVVLWREMSLQREEILVNHSPAHTRYESQLSEPEINEQDHRFWFCCSG